MNGTSERSIGQEVNTWVQTVGIFIAALWAVWTFYFKDIFIPKSAPVNITLNLQLTKIENNGQNATNNKPMVAVEMRASATNPSQRKTYLLPSEWIAYGYKEPDRSSDNDDSFLDDGIKAIQDQEGQFTEKYINYKSNPIVALGSLFSDDTLMPGQTLTRSVIFYVPKGEYEMLEVQTSILSVGREKAVKVKWYLEKSEDGDKEPSFTLYHIGKDGKETEIQKNENGAYIDNENELQQYVSTTMLSLWQGAGKN